jgi:putative transposase
MSTVSIAQLKCGFVSGHGFSRAGELGRRKWALAPAMAIPARNAVPENMLSMSRVFFTTTKTSMGKRLFQTERNAMLLVDVLRSYVAARKFLLHDFVVMPDHLHLLMTVHGDMTIEKAMQLVKGGFSYRLKREFQYAGEVWQRGFSEARADDEESFLRHREYIAQNPVKAGLADFPGQYPFCYVCLAKKKRAGAEAQIPFAAIYGTTEVVP